MKVYLATMGLLMSWYLPSASANTLTLSGVIAKEFNLMLTATSKPMAGCLGKVHQQNLSTEHRVSGHQGFFRQELRATSPRSHEPMACQFSLDKLNIKVVDRHDQPYGEIDLDLRLSATGFKNYYLGRITCNKSSGCQSEPGAKQFKVSVRTGRSEVKVNFESL